MKVSKKQKGFPGKEANKKRNKGSDRSMEVLLPALLGPTKPTDRPADGQIGSQVNIQ